MACEYSYPLSQEIANKSNVLFLNGCRKCNKGYVTHREDSGTFRLKGAGCKAIYSVTFNGNVAVATGGTLEPVKIALQEDGETVNNAVAIVTPAAIGDFFAVSLDTFITVPCGCCVSISVKNISDTTAITALNSNIIISRVA